jgi:lipopolysaccharide biosynthesis glycosyltransferase
LFTFGDYYAPHAATTMESVIRNCPAKLDFVVFHTNDLSGKNIEILTNHFREKLGSFEFFKIDENLLKNLFEKVKRAENTLWNLNTYLKLFAPLLLPDEQYVIYLDCDTIVQGNILDILDGADLSKPVCAVKEYDPAFRWRDINTIQPIERTVCNPLIAITYYQRVYEILDLDKNAPYFNIGVMVINLDYWREHTIAQKVMDFLKAFPEKCYVVEQDALNHVLNGDFFALPPKWNMMCAYCGFFINYTSEQLLIANKQPAILHSIGKGWNLPYSKIGRAYWKYRKFTPWPKKNFHGKFVGLLLRQFRIIMLKAVWSIIAPVFQKYDKSFCISPYVWFGDISMASKAHIRKL